MMPASENFTAAANRLEREIAKCDGKLSRIAAEIEKPSAWTRVTGLPARAAKQRLALQEQLCDLRAARRTLERDHAREALTAGPVFADKEAFLSSTGSVGPAAIGNFPDELADMCERFVASFSSASEG